MTPEYAASTPRTTKPIVDQNAPDMNANGPNLPLISRRNAALQSAEPDIRCGRKSEAARTQATRDETAAKVN